MSTPLPPQGRLGERTHPTASHCFTHTLLCLCGFDYKGKRLLHCWLPWRQCVG